MTMLDMRLQVSLREVTPSAAVVSVSGTPVGAHVDEADSDLLHADNVAPAASTRQRLAASCAVGLALLGAGEAEGVLARDHAAVDKDGLQAFVAAMN